jgi:hypothetical protein
MSHAREACDRGNQPDVRFDPVGESVQSLRSWGATLWKIEAAKAGKDAANQDTCGLVQRRLLLFRYRDG